MYSENVVVTEFKVIENGRKWIYTHFADWERTVQVRTKFRVRCLEIV